MRRLNEKRRSECGGRRCITSVDKKCSHLIFIHRRKDIVRNIPEFNLRSAIDFRGVVTNAGASNGLITTAKLEAEVLKD